MIVALFVFIALVVVLLRWRAARRRTLSGLNGERPVFSVEPPTRRMGSRRNEAL